MLGQNTLIIVEDLSWSRPHRLWKLANRRGHAKIAPREGDLKVVFSGLFLKGRFLDRSPTQRPCYKPPSGGDNRILSVFRASNDDIDTQFGL